MRRITILQVTLQNQNHTEKITFSTPCVRSWKAVLPSFAKNLKVHLFIDHLAHSSSSHHLQFRRYRASFEVLFFHSAHCISGNNHTEWLNTWWVHSDVLWRIKSTRNLSGKKIPLFGEWGPFLFKLKQFRKKYWCTFIMILMVSVTLTCIHCQSQIPNATEILLHHSRTCKNVLRLDYSYKYVCCSCDYRTFERTNIIRHTRKHTGEKPYKCSFCHFSSTTKGNLDVHNKIKHL